MTVERLSGFSSSLERFASRYPGRLHRANLNASRPFPRPADAWGPLYPASEVSADGFVGSSGQRHTRRLGRVEKEAYAATSASSVVVVPCYERRDMVLKRLPSVVAQELEDSAA